ncbi:MAG: GNAT family N-acetyltransferase [Acidimicrobiales bacterium]
MIGRLTVGPVEPRRTYALRQAVLRPHQRVDEMAISDWVEGESVMMAAVTVDGQVVGSAAVMPHTAPAALAAVLPPGRGWHLLSMATRADVRGGGIGRAVLDAALAFVVDSGGAAVWCKARVPAVAFYKRAGFCTFGDAWTEDHIGPHIKMWRAAIDSGDEMEPPG